MKKRTTTMADQAAANQISGHIPMTHRMVLKVLAFLLTLISAVFVLASGFGIQMAFTFEFYTRTQESIREEIFTNIANSIGAHTVEMVLNGWEDELDEYYEMQNISGVSVELPDGTNWSWGDIESTSGQRRYTHTFYWESDYRDVWLYADPDTELLPVTATVLVPNDLVMEDNFYMTDLLLEIAYSARYLVYGIGAVALLVMIFSFVFLMCSAGHRGRYADIQPGWGSWVPIDVLLTAYLLISLCLFGITGGAYYNSPFLQMFVFLLAGAVVAAMTLGLLMSIAVRFKLGKWWQNSLIYYAWALCKRAILKVLAAIRGGFRLLWKIPLVWKSVVVYGLFSMAELMLMVVFVWDPGAYVPVWLICRLLLLPAVIYFALVLRKLQNGGKAIAEGDMSYRINTELMLPEFRKHAENLNQISNGMAAAVEQRLKSERMKTELITNVSHDIKTPLTSIINYSDLIGKEPCENPKIVSYAQVLHRQSDRLKRLIEDLVEASKASTGNLEVHLSPCEVGVMISQAVGEYEQRLEERELMLVTKEPEAPIRIMADGRRLWRVFDNLMNNICKYSQAGTRVYLTLEDSGKDAVIIFRNTSRDALNLSADELMERFVRGDSARNSEGNGLGLSIARSLTELQNGKMDITVDGDLFKVILHFPKIES